VKLLRKIDFLLARYSPDSATLIFVALPEKLSDALDTVVVKKFHDFFSNE